MSCSVTRRVLALGPIVLAAAACSNSPGALSPTGPSQATQTLPAVAETANYVFRASEGDTVYADVQESYHAWLTVALGEAPRQKIAYTKYLSRAHMQATIGVGNTNAWADPAAYAVHTIWPSDNHEVVHLLTSRWGSPVALVNEGLAVAFQVDPARDQIPRWSGTPLHDLTRQFRQQGRFVPLDSVIETASWRGQDPNVAYPESGSFMRWLIDQYGIDRVRNLYARASGPNEAAGGVRSAFATVYGQSFDDLARAWLDFLSR
jgi:hypothetical protein